MVELMRLVLQEPAGRVRSYSSHAKAHNPISKLFPSYCAVHNKGEAPAGGWSFLRGARTLNGFARPYTLLLKEQENARPHLCGCGKGAACTHQNEVARSHWKAMNRSV
jgi:hypothetical protein